jgi:hypothetical protein
MTFTSFTEIGLCPAEHSMPGSKKGSNRSVENIPYNVNEQPKKRNTQNLPVYG